MVDTPPHRMNRAEAIDLIGDWLCSQLGAHPVPVQSAVHMSSKQLTHGWRLAPVAAVNDIIFEIYVDDRFPRSAPRVLWVEAPPFPTIPHVEADGFICALSAIEVIDPHYPLGLVQAVLRNVAKIVDDGISGANDQDFRSEFRSYWNPLALGMPVTSLLDPSGPNRKIAVWRGRHQTVVGENSKQLRAWLSHRADEKRTSMLKIEQGVLLWVGEPLLPTEYPANVSDLRALASRPAIAAEEIVECELGRSQDPLTFVLGGSIEVGASFGVVSIPSRSTINGRKQLPGFRPGRAPPKFLSASRSQLNVVRSEVERADPRWVHGRDHNEDLIDLLPAKVALIGCGSLGSPVARLLAQAGVGSLRMIDPDNLQWANTARHALGGRAIHRNKAKRLAEDLQRDFPSSNVIGHEVSWQTVANETPQFLFDCDLIISTLGSWSDEAELNDRLLNQGIPTPTIFAWSEPRAVGGHAVLTGRGAGCFACGVDRYGTPHFRIVEFAEATLAKEPACGEHFQPYGASQIEAVAALATDVALDYLTERLPAGRHRMCAARGALIESVGGKLSAPWVDLSDGRTRGGNTEEREWPIDPACPSCGGRGRSC